jgi:hypothetical protein
MGADGSRSSADAEPLLASQERSSQLAFRS